MRLLVTSVVVVIAACGTSSPPESPIPGVTGLAVSMEGRPTAAAAARLADMVGEPADPYGAIELVRVHRDESLLIGFERIVLLDSRGRRLASAPGFDAAGSRDELEIAVVGDAGAGVPLVAVVATVGGHREAETRLALYTFENGTILRVFEAVIGREADGEVVNGSVTFDRGELSYRSPGTNHSSRWYFDSGSRRYRIVESTRSRPGT